MPKNDPHLQFQKWAQEHGPVYSLMLGTKTMIVLSNDKAVKELLDKKSANTSARPELYTGQTLLSGDKRMVMMVSRHFYSASTSQANAEQTYGAPWRAVRTNKEYHHTGSMLRNHRFANSSITLCMSTNPQSTCRIKNWRTNNFFTT
jgi:hypothetical protein